MQENWKLLISYRNNNNNNILKYIIKILDGKFCLYVCVYIYIFFFFLSLSLSESHGMRLVWSVSSQVSLLFIGLSGRPESATLGYSSFLAKAIYSRAFGREATLHGEVHPRTKSHRHVLGSKNEGREKKKKENFADINESRVTNIIS